MFKTHTSVKVLSWQELDIYLDILADRIAGETIPKIRPLTQSSIIPAAILAEKLQTEIVFSGDALTFDITSEKNPDCCIFVEEHKELKYSVDVVYEEQKIVLPWKKY